MQQVKIIQQANQNITCPSCQQPYNRLHRKPTDVCPNKHVICQQCAHHLRSNTICPKCATHLQLENATVNTQILNKLPPKTQKEKQIQRWLESPINQINLVTKKTKSTNIAEQQRLIKMNSLQSNEGKKQIKAKLQDNQIDSNINKVKSKINIGSQGNQIETALNQPESRKGQTGIELRFILNTTLHNKSNLQAQSVFKPSTSQGVENIQLQNLRQTQTKIATYRLPGQKQQTSIRLQNESMQVQPQNASQARFRAQSQAKMSQQNSICNNKNYPGFQKKININHISPFPLKYQKNIQQRSQIQKLMSLGNSDRNPLHNEFILSDNMELSEVQQFKGSCLVNLNEQLQKKQASNVSKVLEIQKASIQEKPTQKTESQHFEFKKYLQDAEWFAHMGEIEEGKEVKYILTFMFQFVFIYFNLHFSFKSPRGLCMDSSHGLNFFILRPWLLGSGYADIIMTISMLIAIILFVAKACSAQKFQIFERLVGLIWVGKMFLWTLALTALMLQSLRGLCSADILTYGVGSVVIQTIIMLILLVKKCEQPDEQLVQS